MNRAIKAVVLAAGKGTRMQSETNHLPKVLRLANDQPLLHYVLSALDFIPQENIVLVTGYMHEAVEAKFPTYTSVLQEPQLGTGHAVLCAENELREFDGTVMVCYGDMPLLKKETYEALLAHHEKTGAACTLLAGTTDLALPYGRVLREADGTFCRVVEDRDCTPEQKKIPELNVGIYAFDCKKLLGALARLTTNNAQNEYYLTDVPQILKQDGDIVSVYAAELGEQLIGVNTPDQLKEVEEYLNQRT